MSWLRDDHGRALVLHHRVQKRPGFILDCDLRLFELAAKFLHFRLELSLVLLLLVNAVTARMCQIYLVIVLS